MGANALENLTWQSLKTKIGGHGCIYIMYVSNLCTLHLLV